MNKYCTVCGTKMVEQDIPANSIEWVSFFEGVYDHYRLSEFDSKTGKRLYLKKIYCPVIEYKKKLFGLIKKRREHDEEISKHTFTKEEEQ